MSLVISSIDSTVIFFLLIALNGFFCYTKVPILAIPIAGISVIYLIGFGINYSGLNLVLTLILLVFVFSSLTLNYKDYKK
jgi:uncharacterized membrane protein